MEAIRKSSHKLYFAWNYDKEEAMLNEKSKNGWNLIKGGCFHSVFEKDTTKRYVYRIDFNMNLLRDEEEKFRYTDMNYELGWELINITFNGWIFLRKEYIAGETSEIYDIYTDRDSFNGMMDRWIHFSYAIQIFLIISFCFFTYLFFSSQESMYLLNLAEFILLFAFIHYGMKKMKQKRR
ncbi:MAG: hypothetical protein PWP24_808 [Clostridiales bacterium]|nr:hypothetical protein [Clostridiales bacterium]